MTTESEPTAQEIVRVTLRSGTPIEIDVRDCIENGLVDDAETTGELLSNVRRAINRGDALDNRHGERVLIEPRAVDACTYART